MNNMFVNIARAVVVLNSAVFGSQSFAAAFIISNTGLWRVKNIEAGSITSRLFNNAEAILVPNSADPSKPAIVVERRAHKTEGKERALDFRSIIVGANDGKRLIVNERAYTQNKQARYIVEYVTNDGSEIPVRTIILAVKVDNELFTLSYESAEPIYKKNIDSVRLVMKTVAIKAER